MSVITLTSDLGSGSPLIPLLKGTVLASDPPPALVDISHTLEPFDISRAAFLLGQCWRAFPKGTLHVVAVNDMPEAHSDWMLAIAEGQYFLLQDNGLLSLLLPGTDVPAYALPVSDDGLFILPGLLQAVLHALVLHPTGENVPGWVRKEEVVRRFKFQPVAQGDVIRGVVLFIDSYGNAITNISRELYDDKSKSRPFALKLRTHPPICQLSEHYSDAPVGEILCLFNSAGLLEIALNMGNAASLYGFLPGDVAQVFFGDAPDPT